MAAWKEFAAANGWHFKRGGEEITVVNFRNSLDCFVKKARSVAEKSNIAVKAASNGKDKYGYRQVDYDVYGVTPEEAVALTFFIQTSKLPDLQIPKLPNFQPLKLT